MEHPDVPDAGCILATGSDNGSICLWKHRTDSAQYAPSDLLLSHACPIAGLDYSIGEWNDPNLISIARDGSVSKWRVHDGQNLVHEPQLLAFLAPVSEFQMFSHRRYGLVAGLLSREICVIDTWAGVSIVRQSIFEALSPQLVAQTPFQQCCMPNHCAERKSTSSSSSSKDLCLVLDTFGTFRWGTWQVDVSTVEMKKEPLTSYGQCKFAPRTVPFDRVLNQLAYSLPHAFTWQWPNTQYWHSRVEKNVIRFIRMDEAGVVQSMRRHDHHRFRSKIERMALSEDGTLVLIIWKECWIVVSSAPFVHDCDVQHSLSSSSWSYSDSETSWTSGTFLNSTTLGMSTECGAFYVFNLENTTAAGITIEWMTDQPHLSFPVQTITSAALTKGKCIFSSPQHQSFLSIFDTSTSASFCSSVLFHPVKDKISWIQFCKQEKAGWAWDTNIACDEERVHVTRPRLISVANNDTDESTSNCSIRLTSTPFYRRNSVSVSNDGVLVHGMKDGTICIQSLMPCKTSTPSDATQATGIPITALGYTLIDDHSDFCTSKNRILSNLQRKMHHRSDVAKADDFMEREIETRSPYFAIFTGNANGNIDMWSLGKSSQHPTLLQTLVRQHRGSIVEFHFSSTAVASHTFPHYFCSIGKYQHINVYQILENHPNVRISRRHELYRRNSCPITSISWHMSLLLLLAYCEMDDIVYVWNLTTGTLERCISSNMSSYLSSPSLFDGERNLAAMVQDGGNLNWSTSCSFTLAPQPADLIQFNIDQTGASILKWLTGDQDHHSPPTSLVLLSSLWVWGMNDELDERIRRDLNLTPPDFSQLSFALNGPHGALTIMLVDPSSPSLSLYTHSCTLSATLQLTMISLCSKLSALDPDETRQVLWDRIMNQFSTDLPQSILTQPSAPSHVFQDPSVLAFFATHALDRCPSVQRASKRLLQQTIDRWTSTSRSIISAEWAAKLNCCVLQEQDILGKISQELVQSEKRNPLGQLNILLNRDTVAKWKQAQMFYIGESIGPMILLLSYIGMSYPEDIAPTTARQVCDLLLILVDVDGTYDYLTDRRYAAAKYDKEDQKQVIEYAEFACEILSKGLALWRPHIIDLAALIRRLIQLQVDAAEDRNVVSSSLALLIELGTSEASLFITIIREEIRLESNSVENTMMSGMNCHEDVYRCEAIKCLMTVLKHQLLFMFRYLPSIIETILTRWVNIIVHHEYEHMNNMNT